jgi:hypothetical protein
LAEALPTALLSFELTPPEFRNSRELRVTQLGCLPIGFQPASLFPPVEHRVKRFLPNLKCIPRKLLDALKNCVATYGRRAGTLKISMSSLPWEEFSMAGGVWLPRHSRHSNTTIPGT